MRNEIKRIITEKVWVSILALCLAKLKVLLLTKGRIGKQAVY